MRTEYKTYRNHHSRRGYIIRRYRRLIIAFCLTFSIIIAGSGLLRSEAAIIIQDETYDSLYTGIKLADGDTLQSIADSYNNYNNMDDDEYIEQIKKINNLCDDNIHPGCYLTVMYVK